MDGEWIVPGFRHTRQLGDGATGLVMQAVHLETGTPVAIKYLSAALVSDEEFLARFREEAALLAEVRDEHVVTFHEYIEGPHGAAIVMELVDGVSLAAIINAEGPTSPEAALYVLKGSLLGLAAAHAAGVVHRDYKPGNILVDGNGDSKLADFGVAIRAGDNVPSAGTPAYMAPEQWGGRPLGPATDVYAATAVFYECLTGHSPFPGATLPQLALAHRTAAIPVAAVPDPLRTIVEHGMAKDELARPQSAFEFLTELEATALVAYGSDWEDRGRNNLKERAALLAMLFPLGRHQAPQAGGTSVGTTTVAEADFADYFADSEQPPPPSGPPVDRDYGIDWGDDNDRRPRKAAVAIGVAIIGLLLLGGGTAAVVASNTGNSTAAAPKTTLSPSAAPSTPTDTPTTDSATPTPSTTSPTPSPSPSTTTPAPAQPAPPPTVDTPTPSKTKPTPPPNPFKITDVSVVVSTPTNDTGRGGSGSFTVTVTTSGSPAKHISISVTADGKNTIASGASGSGTSLSGTYNIPGGLCHATITITATASTSTSSKSNSGTWSDDKGNFC